MADPGVRGAEEEGSVAMDPDAALQLLLDAIYEGDLEETRERSRVLSEWLVKDGFMPAALEREQLVTFLDALTELSNLADCEGLDWRREP